MRYLRVAVTIWAIGVGVISLPEEGRARSLDGNKITKGATLIAAARLPLYNKPLTLHGFYYTCGSIIGELAPGEAWTVEEKARVPLLWGSQTWLKLEHVPDDTVGWINLNSAKVVVTPAEKSGLKKP